MNAPRQLRTAPRVVGDVQLAAPKKSPVVIGSRWTPAYAIRLDRAAGLYEEVNSQMLKQAEDYVQRALLVPVRDPASLQRMEAARTARSPKLAPVLEFRVRTPGAPQ